MTPRTKTKAKTTAKAKATAKAKPAVRSELESFPDLNLRLAIVQALQTSKLLPPFDKEAFHERTTGEPYDDNADYNYEYREDIARELASSPVTPAMLAKLQSVSWEAGDELVFDVWTHFDGESEEFDITDLTGLHRLPNLEDFAVFNMCRVERLDPLVGCAKLVTLELVGGGLISDLRPLRELPALRELALGGQAIEDVSPLEGLAIEALDLDDNEDIADLSPLLTLPKLAHLSLQRNVYTEGSKPGFMSKKGNVAVIDQLRKRGVEVKVR